MMTQYVAEQKNNNGDSCSNLSNLSLNLTETNESLSSELYTVFLDDPAENERKISASNIGLMSLSARTISHLNPRFLNNVPSNPSNPLYWSSSTIAVAPVPEADERIPLAEKYFRYAKEAIEKENYAFLRILLGPAIFRGNWAGKISLRDNHIAWLIKEREYDFLEKTQKLLTDLASQYQEIQYHEKILAEYENSLIISQKKKLLFDEEQKVNGIKNQRQTLENQRNFLQGESFKYKQSVYLDKKTRETRDFPALIAAIDLKRAQLEESVRVQLPEMKMIAKNEVEVFDRVRRIYGDHCWRQADPGENYVETMSKIRIHTFRQEPQPFLSVLHEWNNRLSPRSKKNAAPMPANSNLKLNQSQRNFVLARIKAQLFLELKKMKAYVAEEIKKDGEQIYLDRADHMTRLQSEKRYDLPRIKSAEDALQKIHDNLVNKIEIMIEKSDNFTKIIKDLDLPSRIENLEKDCKGDQSSQQKVYAEIENNPDMCIRAFREKATQIVHNNPECIPKDFIEKRSFRYVLDEIVGLTGYCNISLFQDAEGTLQHKLHEVYMRKLHLLDKKTPGLRETRDAIRMVWQEHGGSPHVKNKAGLNAYDVANALPKPDRRPGSEEASKLEHLSLPDWPLLIDGFDTFDKLSNAAKEVIELLKRYAAKTQGQLRCDYSRAFINVFVKEIDRAKSVFAILNKYNESVGELCDDMWITEVADMVKKADPGIIFNRSTLFSWLKELIDRIEKNKLDALPVKKAILIEDKNQAEISNLKEAIKQQGENHAAQIAQLFAMFNKNGAYNHNQEDDQKAQSASQVSLPATSNFPACQAPANTVGFAERNGSLSLPSLSRTRFGNGSPVIFQHNTVPVNRNIVPFTLPPLKNCSGGYQNA